MGPKNWGLAAPCGYLRLRVMLKPASASLALNSAKNAASSRPCTTVLITAPRCAAPVLRGTFETREAFSAVSDFGLRPAPSRRPIPLSSRTAFAAAFITCLGWSTASAAVVWISSPRTSIDTGESAQANSVSASLKFDRTLASPSMFRGSRTSLPQCDPVGEG